MAKPNKCKNHAFENNDVVATFVQKGNNKTNFSSFALNLLTVRTKIVSWRLLISTFTYTKINQVVYDKRLVVRFRNITVEHLSLVYRGKARLNFVLFWFSGK